MTTYTWTATTAGTTSGWAISTNWSPNGPTFNNTLDDYIISTAGPVALGVTNVTGSVRSLTVDDPGATLTVNAGQFTVGNFLTVNNGLLSAIQDNGNIAVGVGATKGTITIGSGGTLDAGSATSNGFYSINGNASGVGNEATLTGSGTVIADGYLDFSNNITVASGATLNFEVANHGPQNGINDAGLLEFDDSVNGGSVTFLGGSGLLILTGTQVGDGATLSGGTWGATISGLTAGTGLTNGIDIIAATSLSAAGLSGANNDILTVTDQASHTYTFDLSGNYSGDTASFVADSSNGEFDVFIQSVCYAAGTSVLTADGEVAIETIRPGDIVATLVDGSLMPQTVKWVGHRDLNLRLHPSPDTIAPVRILAGALGDGLPRRDLVLSPDHCLFIDGALFPAKLLVNGMTIIRDLTAKTVSYHHVELEQHAVLMAEGVPAESYLDTGNRAFFSNAGLATILHPELNLNENLRCWETDACAPLTVSPKAVKPVWDRFAERAVLLGHTAPRRATTQDAGIHLTVDGKIVLPLGTTRKAISFLIPAKARSVRLVSRAIQPSTLTPWLDEPRNLGIAISSITLRDQSGEVVMSADHPALRDGWHVAESSENGAVWRWTTGDAVLPITADGPCTVEIALSGTTTYVESPERLAA